MVSPSPKQRSLRIYFVPCSRMIGKWIIGREGFNLVQTQFDVTSYSRHSVQAVVVKGSWAKKKLLIYQSIYFVTLTYSHEPWVVTKIMRSRIKAAEMSFLHRVAGFSLRDRGSEKSSCPFALKSASWGGAVIWQDAPWTPPFGDFLGITNWEETPCRPRTCWRDYIPHLASWVPLEKLEIVVVERDTLNTLLSLLPPWPNPGKADENE